MLQQRSENSTRKENSWALGVTFIQLLSNGRLYWYGKSSSGFWIQPSLWSYGKQERKSHFSFRISSIGKTIYINSTDIKTQLCDRGICIAQTSTRILRSSRIHHASYEVTCPRRGSLCRGTGYFSSCYNRFCQIVLDETSSRTFCRRTSKNQDICPTCRIFRSSSPRTTRNRTC